MVKSRKSEVGEKNSKASCCRADISVQIASNFLCTFVGSLLASLCLSICPSFRMEQLGFHWRGFHKIWHENFPKPVGKIQVSLKLKIITGTWHEEIITGTLHEEIITGTWHEEIITGTWHEEIITGTWHEDKYTFLSYFTHFFLDEKCSRQKLSRKSKHIYYVQHLVFENRTAYEIMWKNIEEPDRTQMTILHMRIACWINTYSWYIIRIAFHCTSPPQCNVIRTLPALFYSRTRRHIMSFQNSTENCYYFMFCWPASLYNLL